MVYLLKIKYTFETLTTSLRNKLLVDIKYLSRYIQGFVGNIACTGTIHKVF